MPTARGLPPDALDKLVQGVEDLVTAAIRRIAGALARVIHGSPNAGAINPVDDAAMILPLWATATTVTLMPAVQSVWTASAVALSEEFQAAGIANSPLGPDQAAAYLETATNRLVGIGNIVWAEVRTQLAEGVDLGEGIPELAERVMQAAGVSEERATVIARTECLSGDVSVNAANITALFRRWYEGEWIEVVTASGRKFAGTPNHPMLTRRGWVGLGDLKEGDDLVRYGADVQRTGSAGDEHVEDRPPTLSEIWDAVSAVDIPEWERSAEPDFHGDGMDGYVDVLRPDRMLVYGVQSPLDQRLLDSLLTPSHATQAREFGYGSQFATSIPIDSASRRFSVSDWDAFQTETSFYPMPADSVGNAEAINGPSRLVFSEDLSRWVVVSQAVPEPCGMQEFAGGGRGPNLDSRLGRDPGHGRSVASDDSRDDGGPESGFVEFDNLVSVGLRQWKGHVYNLTTRQGFFVADQFYTSNTISASNAASFAQAQTLQDSTMTKVWMATPDARTRHTHVVADGQTQPLMAPFEVGGFPLMFPGDPAGPPGEIINCRCTQGYGFEAEDVPPDETTVASVDGWDVIAAAAEVHTGAMIALAPCVEDAYRLEVGSGEPAEQLHATLVYLGDDADLTPVQRQAILGLCVDLAGSRGPLQLDAFGVSIFNPTNSERDTAIVLPLGGEEGPELAALHDAVTAGVQLLLGDAMPQQHEPFAAHLTLIYSDDLSLPERVTDRNGPILFDHLRVAFGGDVFDIPLSTCGCDYGDALTAGVNNNPEFNRKHLRGPGGRFKTMGERVADAVNSGEGLDGFDRPQLMKAAKAHGVPLARGESEDSIKRKLVDKLGGKGGGAKEPDKPKTPAKRAPRKAAKKAAPKPAAPEAWRQDIDARLDAVRATSKTPVKEDRPLGGGMMGVVNLQTHDDGTKLVSKNGSKGGYIRPPKSQADAEELASLVAPALGVRAPAVVRTSEDDVLMEHIAGKDGGEVVPWGAGLMDTPDGPALVNSDQGRLLGLTDLVIANFDRNNGNWILAPEGDLVAIDHGMSFMGPAQGVEVRAVYDDEDSPGDERWALFVDGQRVADTPTFEERDDAMDEVSDFEGDGSGLKVGDLLDGALGNAFALPFINEARNDFGPNDMSPDDMATIRPRLEGLRPDFARLGREPWFDAMMGRFDAIAANASGDKSRLGKPAAPKKAAKAVKKAATPKVKAYAGPEFTLPKGVDQADYDAYRDLQARIKANDPDLDPDDYSRIFDLRDKLSPDAARRAGQEAHIQTNFGDWAQRNFPDRDVAEVQAELAGKAREAFAGKKVAVRVTPTGLSRVLKDGRFKTFYETGRTESFDPTSRPKAEASMFGLGPDTDPTVRPIYGYVMVDGDRPAGDSDTDALSQYGRIQVVLKDATRPRTTAMFGDSLDNEQQGRPSPIDDPEWRSYTYANGGMLGRALSTPDRDMSGDLFHRATYAEAEIHGGVHTSDIAEVLLPGDTSAALRKQLDDAGIPWRILGEAGAPAAKPAKAAPKKRAPLKAAAPKAAPTAKATTAARAALSKAFDGDTAGFRQAATPMFEGTHAGMTTSIVSVTKAGFGAEGQHMMQVRGTVHDGSGVKVGFFTRTFRRDRGDGSLVVEHDQMFLDKDVQAAGFATSFNRQAIDEYRRAGVSKITLDAGSDVGGYAWARAGYTWADQVSADGIKFHIIFYIGRLRDPNRGFDLPGEAEFDKGRDTEGQLRAAQALLRRMGGNITDPDYPTPYEISQLGRWPGAGRGDMWIGKHFLLGPSGAWLGELKL